MSCSWDEAAAGEYTNDSFAPFLSSHSPSSPPPVGGRKKKRVANPAGTGPKSVKTALTKRRLKEKKRPRHVEEDGQDEEDDDEEEVVERMEEEEEEEEETEEEVEFPAPPPPPQKRRKLQSKQPQQQMHISPRQQQQQQFTPAPTPGGLSSVSTVRGGGGGGGGGGGKKSQAASTPASQLSPEQVPKTVEFTDGPSGKIMSFPVNQKSLMIGLPCSKAAELSAVIQTCPHVDSDCIPLNFYTSEGTQDEHVLEMSFVLPVNTTSTSTKIGHRLFSYWHLPNNLPDVTLFAPKTRLLGFLGYAAGFPNANFFFYVPEITPSVSGCAGAEKLYVVLSETTVDEDGKQHVNTFSTSSTCLSDATVGRLDFEKLTEGAFSVVIPAQVIRVLLKAVGSISNSLTRETVDQTRFINFMFSHNRLHITIYDNEGSSSNLWPLGEGAIVPQDLQRCVMQTWADIIGPTITAATTVGRDPMIKILFCNGVIVVDYPHRCFGRTLVAHSCVVPDNCNDGRENRLSRSSLPGDGEEEGDKEEGQADDFQDV